MNGIERDLEYSADLIRQLERERAAFWPEFVVALLIIGFCLAVRWGWL